MKVEKENIHRNLDEQHYGMIPTMLLWDCVAPYIVMPFDGPANCGVSGCINPLLSIKLWNNQNTEEALEIFLINNYLLSTKRKFFYHSTDPNTSPTPSNVPFYSTA